MQDFDPELFQLADRELDSWNEDFTAFSSVDSNNAWKSHEDIFAPNYGYTLSPVPQSVSSSEQVRSSSLPHVTTFAEHVLPRQDQERQARQTGHPVRDAVYYDSRGLEFDIDQWLHSTTDREDRKDPQSQGGGGNHVDMFRRHPFQQGLQNPIISRDQDYILYPDSPQFDWGLAPHQISRDIGSKELPKRTGAESATSENRHVDASCSDQKSQGPTSTEVRIPGSNYHVPSVQQNRLLELGVPDRYLPSPSPSDSSENVKGISISVSNALYAENAESAANHMQDFPSEYLSVVNNAQSDSGPFDSVELNHQRLVSKLHHRDKSRNPLQLSNIYDRAQLDEFEKQSGAPVTAICEVDRHNRYASSSFCHCTWLTYSAVLVVEHA
jgi:hypothetical protein